MRSPAACYAIPEENARLLRNSVARFEEGQLCQRAVARKRLSTDPADAASAIARRATAALERRNQVAHGRAGIGDRYHPIRLRAERWPQQSRRRAEIQATN